MPLLVRKPDDLVFERRTVARTDALNLPVEQRRAIDVRAHEIADAIVRVQQIALDLRAARSRRSETRTGPADRRPLDAKRAVATRRSKSMLSRSSRGGVPVLSRPHSKPSALSDSASSRDGGSPARPAGCCSGPM